MLENVEKNLFKEKNSGAITYIITIEGFAEIKKQINLTNLLVTAKHASML